MAVTLTIKADTTPIRAAFERLAKVGGDQTRALRQIGLYTLRGGQRRLRGRRSDWGQSRGMLAKSLIMRVTPTMVRVGSPLVYAAVQQLGTASLPGGAIRPKPPRKFLAIPVSPSLRRRGVWPRDLARNSMKYVPNASIQIGSRSWIGPALVRASTEKGKRGKAGEVMFALVRQVRIKGRPYLVFGQEEQDFALKVLRQEYQRAWDRGRGGK